MRTALCISGQPRFLEKGFACINKNILQVLHPDVFIHSWYNPTNQIHFNNDKDPGHQRVGLHIKIKELYKPTRGIIEHQRLNLSHRPIDQYKANPKAPPEIQFSMFYSMKKAIELKMAYEKENNIIYDCVVRTRFDGGILAPLNIYGKYPLDRLYFPDVLQKPDGEGAVCDWLNFGESKIIDEISKIYNLLDQYVQADITLCGENMITFHMSINGIGVEGIPLSFFLIRDIDFNDRSWCGRYW